MEDIVIETVMFKAPPEWGRRVIKRGNEILLQMTDNSGKTWKDIPALPHTKLVLPESRLKSTSSNPYAGLIFQFTEQALTKSLSDDADDYAIDRTADVKPEIMQIIESGQLLSKTEKDDIEVITFLGVYSSRGLSRSEVWVDSENYMRKVPDTYN